MEQFLWADSIPGAITVCDADGKIIYMNQKSRESFTGGDDSLLGRSLFDCHSPQSVEIIKKLMAEGKTNSYTVSKKGLRKFIHQTPFFENGKVAGLVEFSFIIPEDLPHHNRD